MKKKWLAVILSAVMVTSLFGCGGSTQTDDRSVQEDQSAEEAADTEEAVEAVAEIPQILTGVASDYAYDDVSNTCYFETGFPQIRLSEASAAQYGELARKLEETSAAKKKETEEFFSQFKEQAKSDLENNQLMGKYTYDGGVGVRRCDEDVVSLLYGVSSYAGGAHGAYVLSGETYDVKSGERVQLSDVVTDVEGFKEAVISLLNEKCDSADLLITPEEYMSQLEDINALTWVLDYNGVTVIFNEYEIASYAAGIQSVSLSFEKYGDLIDAAYQKAPESYGVEINGAIPYFSDVDGDGVEEEISVDGWMDEYENYASLTVSAGEEACTEELGGVYKMKSTYIRTKEGKSYVYVEQTLDNDYRRISVYDINTKKIENIKDVGAGVSGLPYDEGLGCALYPAINVPESFKLETNTEVLSTQSGVKTYSAGSNGVPVTEDKYYTFETPLVLTAKQDVEVTLIDENTDQEKGKATIKSGEKVEYIRTDGEDVADLKLPDGSIGSVKVDHSDWPYTINGTDVEELFEGIIFAG